jgi:uncharacterized Rmd1/YagE family protein
MDSLKALKSYSRCVAICTAASYDLLGLAAFFKRKGYFTRVSRDVLHIANLKRPGDIFFFNYGCFVSWGIKKSFEEKIIEFTRDFSSHPLQHVETDHFYFAYGNEVTIDTHERMRIDVITLDSQDMQVKLAISYGLAQSIKLEAFEEQIKGTIKANGYLPEEIARNGAVSLTRRDIFRRMGEIFIARSSINVSIEYLDAPEFFWRNPNLEPFYIMTKKFLDIQSRVMALNQKLDVLQELLDILNSQVQHRHSSLLESIIILLIAVEIIISLFQFHVV